MKNLQETKNKLLNYIQWLKKRNLSVNTIINYPIAVQQYQGKYSTLNLIAYVKKLWNTYQAGSIQTKIAALKSYAKYQKLPIDWANVIRLIPQVQKKFFTTIDEKELEQLKKARNKESQALQHRNNLILDFLFYTGVRISELINIRHTDYQVRSLQVWGKGNKIRYIFLPDFLTNELNPLKKGYLFTTIQGKPLPREWIYQIIQERTTLAGIEKNITPHTFRRSFATLLNSRGCKLTTIQKLLGHSNITTTAQYIHNDYETLYQDYSKLWTNSNLNN